MTLATGRVGNKSAVRAKSRRGWPRGRSVISSVGQSTCRNRWCWAGLWGPSRRIPSQISRLQRSRGRTVAARHSKRSSVYLPSRCSVLHNLRQSGAGRTASSLERSSACCTTGAPSGRSTTAVSATASCGRPADSTSPGCLRSGRSVHQIRYGSMMGGTLRQEAHQRVRQAAKASPPARGWGAPTGRCEAEPGCCAGGAAVRVWVRVWVRGGVRWVPGLGGCERGVRGQGGVGREGAGKHAVVRFDGGGSVRMLRLFA